MALTSYVTQRMMNTLTSEMDFLYVIEAGTAPTLNTAITGLSARVLDGAKTLLWGSASFNVGTQITSAVTTNSATSTPLNYSIPQNKNLGYYVYVDSGTIMAYETIFGAPSYGTGDGAFYVRGITLNMGEQV